MVGFILVIVLLLLAAFSWATVVKIHSENNRFLSLLPWWVLGYGVSMAMYCPEAFFRIHSKAEFIIIGLIFFISFAFACLIIACLVIALLNKQYKNAGRIVGIGVILIIYSFIVILFAGMGEGMFDNFGKRHPIPADMECEDTQLEEGWNRRSHTQQEWDSAMISHEFVLLGGLGMYRYAVYLPPMEEEGDIYLKMYEATSDIPLSEGNVKYNSTLHVLPSDSAVLYQMPDEPFSVRNENKSYFMINEGSWGDYYAARAELWFQPTTGNEPRMLMSKIFRIEGHSR